MMYNVAKINIAMLRKLLVFSVIMFAFGYALVPFYEKFCEVAGINNLLKPDVADKDIKVDTTRLVMIQLDSNVRGLPWQFKALQSNIRIHPGESIEVMYEISNNSDQETSGQAIPSYSPRVLEKYLKKFECFCFTKQVLKPGETRQMPVKFVIDPQIPADITTMTISYTFFSLGAVN
ncbi:MAG TPA: cytochrome c oxidase assembly protein [Nitrosomonas sp.]|nr:cytochrome c oxidase assembly protein [Nitrosomonas sp.]HMY60879.1 cytochrome c oxidase assembly protein [Nitrosomonas sp.]HMY89820.1 cytochrome c oxidase assembly protein [Nitrosomonas sp.]HNA69607.1 cytochrome c oxidase assembly protein [Nitrosomonas sp.]HNB00168.1 cytochrome c oxidase assembly protein [Nitrosomonas sp.]